MYLLMRYLHARQSSQVILPHGASARVAREKIDIKVPLLVSTCIIMCKATIVHEVTSIIISQTNIIYFSFHCGNG